MTLIAGINISDRRVIIDVDEKKMRLNMEVTVMMDQTLMRGEIIFRHTTTMPLIKRITMIRMDLLKVGNWNLSHMIWTFLI